MAARILLIIPYLTIFLIIISIFTTEKNDTNSSNNHCPTNRYTFFIWNGSKYSVHKLASNYNND